MKVDRKQSYWSDPGGPAMFLGHVREAVRARAMELIGGEKPLFVPNDWRAQTLARMFRGRLAFTDNQRLVAAVLAVDTGMAPEKALRAVLSGWWWLAPRWRACTR